MPYADSEKRREYDRRRHAEAKEAALVCPECKKRRSTPETLRVHRWLAHDVRVGPPEVDR